MKKLNVTRLNEVSPNESDIKSVGCKMLKKLSMGITIS